MPLTTAEAITQLRELLDREGYFTNVGEGPSMFLLYVLTETPDGRTRKATVEVKEGGRTPSMIIYDSSRRPLVTSSRLNATVSQIFKILD